MGCCIMSGVRYCCIALDGVLRWVRAVVVLGIASLAVAAGPADAARSQKPGTKPALVRVTRVTGAPAQIAQGAAFTVSVTVRNDGRKTAWLALVAYLTRSSKPRGRALKSALVRGHARVARRSRVKLTLSVTVPASEQAGAHTLFVCVRAKGGCARGGRVSLCGAALRPS